MFERERCWRERGGERGRERERREREIFEREKGERDVWGGGGGDVQPQR